jgi:peptidoglycan/LPS O-acetylase OafA/YrhL
MMASPVHTPLSRNETTTTTNNNNATLSAAELRHQERIHNLTASAAANAAFSDPLDRWQPQPHWSIAPGGNSNFHNDTAPDLTSKHCYDGLVQFFAAARRHPNGDGGKMLSLATEASSHPSGLLAVYAQPWIYAGPGLGNMDECPLQVCLAGGTGRDSLTFASVCVIPNCEASDLVAHDFVERLETAAATAQPGEASSTTQSLVQEYIRLHDQIAEVGQFLGTGWVCGDYKVDWQLVPSILWGSFLLLCMLLSVWGTFGPPSRKRRRTRFEDDDKESRLTHTESTANTIIQHNGMHIPDTPLDTEMHSLLWHSQQHQYSTLDGSSTPTLVNGHHKQEDITSHNGLLSSKLSHRTLSTLTPFWSAWNMTAHLHRLIQHRPETACLDGLKVGSILWIVSAHVMAIQSSTAAGYLNPVDFLPPHGITTTLLGQLLFSSRYAVDTFLCISGYLAVYVLKRKFQWDRTTKMTTKWITLVGVLLMRLLRILPLYMFCLGFWMYIAPHLGSGPFWYQWENFLEPCRHYWWTNLLFVNNFLPWGVSTTANCFYHSWYLAVDVQLFFLFSPWLVLLYLRSPVLGQRVAILLWIMSVVITAVLSYTQEWSVNTFDGASVALFDVEGYAKPHIRAQSYLAGILVAMSSSSLRKKPKSSLARNKQCFFLTKEGWLLTLAISCLLFLSFVTVTGAYSRRACTFEEMPAFDDCGSLWSPTATFLYTAFSRAIWSICVAIIMALCLERKNDTDKKEDQANDGSKHSHGKHHHLDNPVKFVLSWNVWTPLAHLSYGAYLIHPIVIFVWKLGGREKTAFRVLSFVMDFCSITVFTFLLSLFAALVVEFPFGILLHPKSPLFEMISKKR